LYLQQKNNLATSVSSLLGCNPEQILTLLNRPKDNKSQGDWALPCFQLAKEQKSNPAAFAASLVEKLCSSDLPSFGFLKVEAAGPYVNFFLDRQYWNAKIITATLNAGDDVAKVRSDNPQTIVLEYSAPNIAKTIHVGHLRTTLIGLCLDRVLRHRGYSVVSVNHLGDWGTQFGFVYAGCQLYGKPENPTVEELVDLYVKATTLRKLQDEKKVPPEDADKPDVNKMAREYFIRLESGDKEAVEFWQWCLDISLVYLKAIYTRLGIFFDHYTGESFYKDMVPQIEKIVRDSGILEESEGALGVDLGKELGFVRIFAEDGRSLYITRDIAAAMYRHDTFKPYKNLYVVAHQQTLHFKQLKEIMRRMKHPCADEIVHIPFGFVPGMKTRGGGAISLKFFLDEAYDKAKFAYENLVQKKVEISGNEDPAEKVAIGATYFYFLSHSNLKDFHFSWDEALSFQGDTGPYCQYALARLNSIIDKAEQEGISYKNLPQNLGQILSDDASHGLVSLISSLDEVLNDVVRTYEPNILADYIIKLTHTFSSAYKHLRVIGEEKDVASARLALFVAVRNTLKTALYLLGVPTVERM
jgi:arginyl-tRNA synthetase